MNVEIKLSSKGGSNVGIGNACSLHIVQSVSAPEHSVLAQLAAFLFVSNQFSVYQNLFAPSLFSGAAAVLHRQKVS